jgi:hypothetical protein
VASNMSCMFDLQVEFAVTANVSCVFDLQEIVLSLNYG